MSKADSLFRVIDTPDSGTIDAQEFAVLYDAIKKDLEEELEKQSVLERAASSSARKFKMLLLFVAVLVAFLAASVAANFAVIFTLVDSAITTVTTSTGLLEVKGSDTIIKTAIATQDVPLIAAPALDFDTLSEVKSLKVVYRTMREERIESQLTVVGVRKYNDTFVEFVTSVDGETVEALNGIASLVRYPTTANGLTMPMKYRICSGNATCSAFKARGVDVSSAVAEAKAMLEASGFRSAARRLAPGFANLFMCWFGFWVWSACGVFGGSLCPYGTVTDATVYYFNGLAPFVVRHVVFMLHGLGGNAAMMWNIYCFPLMFWCPMFHIFAFRHLAFVFPSSGIDGQLCDAPEVGIAIGQCITGKAWGPNLKSTSSYSASAMRLSTLMCGDAYSFSMGICWSAGWLGYFGVGAGSEAMIYGFSNGGGFAVFANFNYGTIISKGVAMDYHAWGDYEVWIPSHLPTSGALGLNLKLYDNCASWMWSTKGIVPETIIDAAGVPTTPLTLIDAGGLALPTGPMTMWYGGWGFGFVKFYQWSWTNPSDGRRLVWAVHGSSPFNINLCNQNIVGFNIDGKIVHFAMQYFSGLLLDIWDWLNPLTGPYFSGFGSLSFTANKPSPPPAPAPPPFPPVAIQDGGETPAIPACKFGTEYSREECKKLTRLHSFYTTSDGHLISIYNASSNLAPEVCSDDGRRVRRLYDMRIEAIQGRAHRRALQQRTKQQKQQSARHSNAAAKKVNDLLAVDGRFEVRENRRKLLSVTKATLKRTKSRRLKSGPPCPEAEEVFMMAEQFRYQCDMGDKKACDLVNKHEAEAFKLCGIEKDDACEDLPFPEHFTVDYVFGDKAATCSNAMKEWACDQPIMMCHCSKTCNMCSKHYCDGGDEFQQDTPGQDAPPDNGQPPCPDAYPLYAEAEELSLQCNAGDLAACEQAMAVRREAYRLCYYQATDEPEQLLGPAAYVFGSVDKSDVIEENRRDQEVLMSDLTIFVKSCPIRTTYYGLGSGAGGSGSGVGMSSIMPQTDFCLAQLPKFDEACMNLGIFAYDSMTCVSGLLEYLGMFPEYEMFHLQLTGHAYISDDEMKTYAQSIVQAASVADLETVQATLLGANVAGFQLDGLSHIPAPDDSDGSSYHKVESEALNFGADKLYLQAVSGNSFNSAYALEAEAETQDSKDLIASYKSLVETKNLPGPNKALWSNTECDIAGSLQACDNADENVPLYRVSNAMAVPTLVADSVVPPIPEADDYCPNKVSRSTMITKELMSNGGGMSSEAITSLTQTFGLKQVPELLDAKTWTAENVTFELDQKDALDEDIEVMTIDSYYAPPAPPDMEHNGGSDAQQDYLEAREDEVWLQRKAVLYISSFLSRLRNSTGIMDRIGAPSYRGPAPVMRYGGTMLQCFARSTSACRLLQSASASDAYAACFRDGNPSVAERVSVDQLVAGDEVLASNVATSRVVVNQHVKVAATAPMLTMHFEGGSLSLTADHMLLLDGMLAPARHATTGSVLSSGLKVSSVSRGAGGVANPITAMGTILVSNGSDVEPVLAATANEHLIDLLAFSNRMASVKLALLFPASAQAYYDVAVEPALSAAFLADATLRLSSAVPVISTSAFLLLDVVLVFGFIAVSFGKMLAACAGIATVARLASRK